MARTKAKAAMQSDLSGRGDLTLSEILSDRSKPRDFTIWIVGNTPLICHAWSEKARLEMLSKQVKAARSGRDQRNPEDDFVSSLYQIGDNEYGFPVTGIKNAIISTAHKDKGIAKTDVRKALWLDSVIVSARPALENAVCDMPLVRIYGSKPEMREDMVRVGTGMNRTATLAYRGQFKFWAIRLTGNLRDKEVSAMQFGRALEDSGQTVGIGDWRMERNGIFGAYHIASPAETEAWEKFAAGKGPLPQYKTAGAAVVDLMSQVRTRKKAA